MAEEQAQRDPVGEIMAPYKLSAGASDGRVWARLWCTDCDAKLWSQSQEGGTGLWPFIDLQRVIAAHMHDVHDPQGPHTKR